MTDELASPADFMLHANLAGSFSIIAAAWSKTSFAFTLLRIASGRWMPWFIWFVIISMNLALGGGVLVTWIQCWPVEKTWRTSAVEGTCWPKSIHINYNIFAASYSGLFKMFVDVLDPAAVDGMPVLVAATAGTARHQLVLDHALRPLFSYLRAVVVPTGVFAATEDFGGGEHATLGDRITRAASELAALMVSEAGAVAGFTPGPRPRSIPRSSSASAHTHASARSGERPGPA